MRTGGEGWGARLGEKAGGQGWGARLGSSRQHLPCEDPGHWARGDLLFGTEMPRIDFISFQIFLPTPAWAPASVPFSEATLPRLCALHLQSSLPSRSPEGFFSSAHWLKGPQIHPLPAPPPKRVSRTRVLSGPACVLQLQPITLSPALSPHRPMLSSESLQTFSGSEAPTTTTSIYLHSITSASRSLP